MMQKNSEYTQNESIKAKRPVASLLDLQGQKIRIGSFSNKKHSS